MKLPHPPWYWIYSRATDVLFLSAIIIRHAELFAYAARTVRAIEEEETRLVAIK